MRCFFLVVFVFVLSGCSSKSPSAEDASLAAAIGGQVPAVYFSDPNNCGKLGRTCAENEICTSGSCVDVSRPTSCGAPPNSCRSGQCVKNIQGAYACTPQNWNVTTLADNCTSACACYCSDGYVGKICGNFCSNPNNACSGACTQDTPLVTYCSSNLNQFDAICPPSVLKPQDLIQCPAPYVSSGGKCAYPFSDPNNCGTAGNKCSSDPTNTAQGRTACFSGVCSKPNPRFIFISGNLFPFSSGTLTADLLCQSEATTLGLPGTYKAILAQKDKSLWDVVNSFASADRDVFSPKGIIIKTDTFSFNRMSDSLSPKQTGVSDPETLKNSAKACSRALTPGIMPYLDCVNQGFSGNVIFRDLSVISPGLFVTGVPVAGSIGAPGTNSDSFYTLASEQSTCNNWTSSDPAYGANNVGVGNNLNTNWAGYNFYHNPDYSCLGSAPVLCLQTDDP